MDNTLLTHDYQPILSSSARETTHDETTVPLQRRPSTRAADDTWLLVRQPDPEELDWINEVPPQYHGPQNATYPDRRRDVMMVLISAVFVILIMVTGMALMVSVLTDERTPTHIRISSTSQQ